MLLDTQRDTGGTSCLCSLLISSKFLHTFWNLTDMDQQEEDQEEDVLKKLFEERLYKLAISFKHMYVTSPRHQNMC